MHPNEIHARLLYIAQQLLIVVYQIDEGQRKPLFDAMRSIGTILHPVQRPESDDNTLNRPTVPFSTK